MNRGEIQQHVYDTLGKILIDKSEIHEHSTFKDLVLDEDDVDKLFSLLERDFNFVLPDFMRTFAARNPEHLGLPLLVDVIVWMKQK